MSTQDKERVRFEAWRETAPWYVVAKPDADEDRHSDAASTFRLMNIAAHEAWAAAAAGREDLLAVCRMVTMLRQMGGMLPGVREVLDELVKDAEAAIAKATGGAV